MNCCMVTLAPAAAPRERERGRIRGPERVDQGVLAASKRDARNSDGQLGAACLARLTHRRLCPGARRTGWRCSAPGCEQEGQGRGSRGDADVQAGGAGAAAGCVCMLAARREGDKRPRTRRWLLRRPARATHPMHTKADTGPRQAMNLPPRLLVPRHCHTARHTNQLAQMALRKTCGQQEGARGRHPTVGTPLPLSSSSAAGRCAHLGPARPQRQPPTCVKVAEVL